MYLPGIKTGVGVDEVISTGFAQWAVISIAFGSKKTVGRDRRRSTGPTVAHDSGDAPRARRRNLDLDYLEAMMTPLECSSGRQGGNLPTSAFFHARAPPFRAAARSHGASHVGRVVGRTSIRRQASRIPSAYGLDRATSPPPTSAVNRGSRRRPRPSAVPSRHERAGHACARPISSRFRSTSGSHSAPRTPAS